MLLAGRFKCPSPANPGNKTPFGASVFMHQLLCAWAFVRVLKCSSGRQARNGVLILRLWASGLFRDWSSGQANRHRRKIFPLVRSHHGCPPWLWGAWVMDAGVASTAGSSRLVARSRDRSLACGSITRAPSWSTPSPERRGRCLLVP